MGAGSGKRALRAPLGPQWQPSKREPSSHKYMVSPSKGGIGKSCFDGGSASSRFSRYSGYERSQGCGMGPCGFSQGEGGGRGGATAGNREEGLIAGKVALYLSSLECPAFMIKNLCL